MQKGNLIFVNGTSSVGKTSTCRELQRLLGSSYLYISMDSILNMLSEDIFCLDKSKDIFLKKTDGIYASKRNDGSYDICTGMLGDKLFTDMYDALQLFLDKGWNVIFDVVETSFKDMNRVKLQFKEYNPLYIYLYANKVVLMQREKDRGNRLVGHTVNLLNAFESQDLHDMQIDTSDILPKDVALQIKQFEMQ